MSFFDKIIEMSQILKFILASVFLPLAFSFAEDSRDWRSPNFSGQDRVLGYDESTFKIPDGLQPAVSFWVDVYTKYSSFEGVLHDSENLGCVYKTVDLRPILNNPLLSDRKKAKAQESMLDEEKKKISERLKHIQKTPVTDLAADELKIVECLKDDPSQNKYTEAAKMDRIRFQQGLKDRTSDAIFYSGRYIEQMENIFRDLNLPIELTRLVFVESSFNVFARSKVGASGLWQIMRYTARGRLRMNPAIDNRNHPMDATRFAAKMLKSNYLMLDSWPLAITGYNHGPAGIRRISEKNKTKDIVELIRSDRVTHTFGFASRNFYACFLAALEVEKKADKYFPGQRWAKPLDQLEISLPQGLAYRDLLEWFGKDDRRAQLFNPHISTAARKGQVSLPKGTLIYVPSAMYLTAITELKANAAVRKPTQERETKITKYRVEKGDTLEKIASDFRVGVRKILKANDIAHANRIRAGQLLVIPD